MCYNNFVPKTNTIYFFTYSSSTNVGTDINRSTAYDFPLTFHGNHGPISCTVSETNGDFGRKSQIFPTPCILAPLKGFPVELGIDAGGQKTRMMALPGRERSLAISSAVWTVDTINQRDRRIETGRQQRPRLRIASRGILYKKSLKIPASSSLTLCVLK